jgi:hypothetical protein
VGGGGGVGAFGHPSHGPRGMIPPPAGVG